MKHSGLILPILFTLFSSFITAQTTISARLVDSLSKRPIPYATIQTAHKKGVISNGEGFFILQLNDTAQIDSLYISCIGYGSIAKPLIQFQDSIIYLTESAIELDQVVVSNKNLTVEEILQRVKDSLPKLYDTGLSKKRLFYRDAYLQQITKANYDLKKSTIPEFNKAFIDSLFGSIPKKHDYYTEILCDLSSNLNGSDQKIALIKASELYDKTAEIGVAALEEKFNTVIKKRVKPDSYFKIKSGIFGTKVEGDELFETEEEKAESEMLKEELEKKKKEEKERKANFAKYRRRQLGDIYSGLLVGEEPRLNILEKSNRYEFVLDNFTFLGLDPVYVISFSPKRSEDYKGKLYVSADDFGILRFDYENVKSLRSIKLLGFSYKENIDRGTVFFQKGYQGKYQLKYYERESGMLTGIKRPLKIIEKNKHVKGRRKQNELSMKIDFALTGFNKYEVVVFDAQPLAQSEFDGITEDNSVLPTYMPAYDPEFWKGYNIMEPNQAIREFKAQEAE
ncbi:carboxypeptidase-like regulatory domain-containing protein [Sediminicola luteus]|uniref:Carboxypeptidase-like regulatory domain-containing protein n=1 Tax=Sediminicola luteus TaxID=319238 RepID=A0A2A4GE50_9FLAO|nr:carboxypeptidase-like regulatory domain-containing protein [Sediminicola luteus]PCE66260.1 hypothetical protein B7P33_02890 [Sediminicola luteus]